MLVAGHPPPAPGDQIGSSWDRVSATYLQDLGVRLVRGRHFTAADDEKAEPVAVVNEAFVRRFFKSDEDPLDQRFGLNLPENVNTFRIVGIVRDAKFAGFALGQPARPMFFVPLAQTVDYANPMMKRIEAQSHFVRGLLLVTDVPPGTLEPQLKRVLAEADPNLTVTSVRTLQQQVDRSFDQQRAVASLAGLFGVVALVLAAIGLYGVTAYSVAQRTNEIGIRMALGADRGNVVGMVLQGAFRRVVIGLAARPAAGGRRRLPAFGPALRRAVLGSAGARRRRRGARRLRVRRGDHPGEPGGVDRADQGAAHRLNQRVLQGSTGFREVPRGSVPQGSTRFYRVRGSGPLAPANPMNPEPRTQNPEPRTQNLAEP